MANGPAMQRSPYGESPQAQPVAKRELVSWWNKFKKAPTRKDEAEAAPATLGIFGVPLQVSIRYANVAISLLDNNNQSFIYGYVPIVVAKCGVFLKERATDVEGIFRLAGSEKRIKELRDIFNMPDRYGKGLDWSGFTVHDAANILRRYIRELPEPVVPLDFYERFRDPIRGHQLQAAGDPEVEKTIEGGYVEENAIRTYQQLITELPPLNRQLLLYVLDLLSVFASKCEVNRMTSANLSAIFQPGLLNNPEHHQAPLEYRLSQDVVAFLIEKQDHFLVGMAGTAADEKTIEDIKSATPPPAASPTSPKASGIGRSASTTSARSSLRRTDGVRRHVSVGSRHSLHSNHTPSPVTPPPASSPYTPKSGGGVHRSNTVPSKKGTSPAIGSERYSRSPNTPIQPANAAFAALVVSTPTASQDVNVPTPAHEQPTSAAIAEPTEGEGRASNHFLRPFLGRMSSREPSQERQGLAIGGLSAGVPQSDEAGTTSNAISSLGTPSKERGFSSLFKSSPASDNEKRDKLRPNKLQKKRPDGVISNHSSTHSLVGNSRAASPLLVAAHPRGSVSSASYIDGQTSETSYRPFDATEEVYKTPIEAPVDTQQHAFPTSPANGEEAVALKDNPSRQSAITLKPGDTTMTESLESTTEKTPVISDTATLQSTAVTEQSPFAPISSGESLTDHQSDELHDQSRTEKEKRSFWRLTSPTRKERKHQAESSLSAPQGLGSSNAAERSTSSIGSIPKPRKSMADESHSTGASAPFAAAVPAEEPDSTLVGSPPQEKKGPIRWIRGKLNERKEEKERTKSPSPLEGPEARQNLNAVTAGDGSNNQGQETEPAQEPSPATTNPPEQLLSSEEKAGEQT